MNNTAIPPNPGDLLMRSNATAQAFKGLES